MEKKPFQSKQQKLQKNERWKPYIRYQKETDSWIAKAVRKEQEDHGGIQEPMDKITPKIRILMDRKELDIIARIVAYMYHEKREEYEESASDLRKKHIYRDFKDIDQWLNIQYQRLDQQEEKDKHINNLDQEIKDEQSK